MVVMILERVSPSLRGELTKWLIQPKSGVFVGHVSARVRDLLWQRVDRSVKDGAAILIHDSNNEQGFAIHTIGNTRRIIKDFDGLLLPKTSNKS